MIRYRALGVLLVFAVSCGLAHGKTLVVKRVLSAAATGKQALTNGDLEQLAEGRIAGVNPWEKGYEVAAEAHSGKVSARCTIADAAAGQWGLTYPVELNQRQPSPFTAQLWSKAQDVSGTADNNYSLYIDLTYTDGTELWGQVVPFATGTHDWQQRTITVVPEKPIALVSFHGIFRGHTGTAWFDDFSLQVLDLPAGVRMFDGVAVEGGGPPAAARTTPVLACKPLGLALAADGTFLMANGRSGGLLVRDAARKSDFRQPLGALRKTATGAHSEATDEELGLKLTADYRLDALGALHVTGVVADLAGEDRGVSVYCSLPGLAVQKWHDDVRTSRTVEAGQSYSTSTVVGCGANGRMSQYPFACVTAADGDYSVGAPLDPPHLYRFVYEAAERDFYGVEDLGLTRDCKTPGQAPFHFVIFRAAGGFRGALDRYYHLYPQFFTKRNKIEGNWMAFDDIEAVQDPQDFYFAFKEGTNNPTYDEANGILTYTYVEPTSYWLAMGKLPRTVEAALQLLGEQAAQKPPHAAASATLTSGLKTPEGEPLMRLENAPWCDGALFFNNPDPDLPTTPEHPLNQGQRLWQSINNELNRQTADKTIAGWRGWEEGFNAAPGQGRGGSQAALVDRRTAGSGQGLGQTISLRQTAPGKVNLSVWCRTEGMTGEADKDFSLFCDLGLANGQPSWGHSASLPLGTNDWRRVDLTLDVPQPITTISLWLLVRGNHTGKVWFDDLSVVAAGSAKELAQNGSFEPRQLAPVTVDGTYIDSLEMGANLLDFDRAHWRAADVPLVYATDTGRPAELLMFASYEFIKDVSDKMHAEGKMIFANAVLHRFAQNAAVLDLMGTETNWHSGGAWHPMTDRDCNFKRALCYQRPYLLLQNTVFEDFPVEMVEKYMKRSIFYGMFPSFFSHNAADATYWTRPQIYNRDRHLFKRYLPVAQRLGKAGWEPLNFATTGNAKVYVERYGKGAELYYVLFCDSDKPQDFRLQVDLKALGERVAGLEDVLAGGRAAATLKGTQLTLAGTLGAEDLRVLKAVR